MDIESLKSFFCFLCFWFFVRKEDGRKEGRSYLLSYSNRRLLQQGYYVLSCIVFPSLFFVFEESPRNCLFENHEESGCTPMNNPTVYIGLTPLEPPNPSLYYDQVFPPAKLVSSCKVASYRNHTTMLGGFSDREPRRRVSNGFGHKVLRWRCESTFLFWLDLFFSE